MSDILASNSERDEDGCLEPSSLKCQAADMCKQSQLKEHIADLTFLTTVYLQSKYV